VTISDQGYRSSMSRPVSILEPTGPTYTKLLAFAMRKRSLFSLVWRDQLHFSASAYANRSWRRRVPLCGRDRCGGGPVQRAGARAWYEVVLEPSL